MRRTATDVSHPSSETAPFLSVVVRTQGTRPEPLRDALLCLSGQTVPDFEVLLAVHGASPDGQAEVERAVAELPCSLRRRVSLLTVAPGRRAAPLNTAFGQAAGRYVAVLDDDDLVLGHWVETFAAAVANAPGTVVRAVCVEQPVEPATWNGRAGARAVGPMAMRYPATFDLVDHLERNYTPFMAYAFPREVFHQHALRFDESLDVCEDWDFALRAALLVGVTSAPVVTAVYRRWSTGSSSYSAHSSEEWRRAERQVLEKLDAETHVFPPGTISAIRRAREQVLQDLEALRERNAELEAQARGMELSASWRLTAPLRAVRNRGRRRP
jgi:hypothetical protein